MPHSLDTAPKRHLNQADTFRKGYDAKSAEIHELGFKTARDKFNSENPPGQPWAGSEAGLAYANGEYRALCDAL